MPGTNNCPTAGPQTTLPPGVTAQPSPPPISVIFLLYFEIIFENFSFSCRLILVLQQRHRVV